MSSQIAGIILGIISSIATIILPIRGYIQHKSKTPYTAIDWFIVVVCAMIAIISWFSVFGLFD